jgi:hypothetical protein
MAINRKLRADLLKLLDVSKQRLSQRVKNAKKSHGPMSTEEATYVIAHLEGLDLSKYLDKSVVDRVRSIILSKSAPSMPMAKKKKVGQRVVVIKIGTEIPQVDVLLSTTLSEDAKKMAKIYPKYYVLENSIRVVIRRVLGRAYGDGWWQNKVSKQIQDDVKRRIDKEDREPWHGKRGQHEIYYSDFKDLKNIISKNWQDFETLFPSQQWIFQRLEELEHPRNVVAHHNPLSKDDTKRIELYFADWISLLKTKKDLIGS